jgi:hypothetical protein
MKNRFVWTKDINTLTYTLRYNGYVAIVNREENDVGIDTGVNPTFQVVDKNGFWVLKGEALTGNLARRVCESILEGLVE